MRHFLRILPALLLCMLAMSCQPLLNDPTKPELSGGPGNIIFSCRGRSIQCLAQVDTTGKLSVLLRSLESNTAIEFGEVKQLSNGSYMVMATVQPKEGDPSLGDDMTVQNLAFLIDPIKVQKISLKGEVVYESDNMVVMMASEPIPN